ncbi:MAG: hypothetical protein HRU71_03435 [Planctomycetia bacterium]|nr:MAG: hypothetical protein HRU71_03435 [Planctomycetia bacterium]
MTISFIFLSVIYSCQRHEAIPDSLARALTARSVFKTLKATYRESTVIPRDKPRIRNYDLRIDKQGEMLIDFFGDDDGKCLISRADGPSFGSPSDWSGIRFVTDRE